MLLVNTKKYILALTVKKSHLDVHFSQFSFSARLILVDI